MKTKKQKEKPKYNVWQNSMYVIKNAWEQDKIVLWVILAQIWLTVAISVVGLFLPQTVVAQIAGGADQKTLAATVLAFTIVTVLLQAGKNYLETGNRTRRIGLRVGICQAILTKAITTDYANLDEKAFTDAKQKAHSTTNNNGASTEQIYYTFTQLGINLLGFVLYIILLVSINPLVLLITAATTILGVRVRQWANKWEYDHDNESVAYSNRLWYIQTVGENYALSKDIRLFAMTNWFRDIFSANMKLIYDSKRRIHIRYLAADAVDCLAAFMREGLAYAYLIWQALYHGLPADQFVLLFAAIGGFSGWIMGILNEYADLSRHSLNYCRLREYLEFPNRFTGDQGESISPEKGKAYAIELKNVSFRYKGADENTLEHINLVIKPGEKLAVVGLNGAGKTTLVKLLCGLYDPTEGTVLLNGKDIRGYNRKQYYTLFTAVFQDFNILPLSVAENIAQQPEEDADHEKIKRCLALADLDKKIFALPDGTSSLLIKSVNDNAVELSGGETQRLMLARALYKDSPVMILDEPTAALDPIAESRLYSRYNELSAGKTSVYISHRLASTRFCDRIILMDGKTITECGSHDALIKQGGKYADLFEIQSQYYKDNGGDGL